MASYSISKSNKSELWNRLSYRVLPYLFEVGNQTFRNDNKFARSVSDYQDISGILSCNAVSSSLECQINNVRSKQAGLDIFPFI